MKEKENSIRELKLDEAEQKHFKRFPLSFVCGIKASSEEKL